MHAACMHCETCVKQTERQFLFGCATTGQDMCLRSGQRTRAPTLEVTRTRRGHSGREQQNTFCDGRILEPVHERIITLKHILVEGFDGRRQASGGTCQQPPELNDLWRPQAYPNTQSHCHRHCRTRMGHMQLEQHASGQHDNNQHTSRHASQHVSGQHKSSRAATHMQGLQANVQADMQADMQAASQHASDQNMQAGVQANIQADNKKDQ